MWVVNLKKQWPKVTDKLGGAMQTQLVLADLSPESAAGTGQCRPFHKPGEYDTSPQTSEEMAAGPLWP